MSDIDELYYDAEDLLKRMIATPGISRDEARVADIVEQQMLQWHL